MHKTDFLIIGAGVVGLSIARELQRRQPRVRVTVIDKEAGPAQHASGRNSGVLHSGVYYTADSFRIAHDFDLGNRYAIFESPKGAG